MTDSKAGAEGDGATDKLELTPSPGPEIHIEDASPEAPSADISDVEPSDAEAASPARTAANIDVEFYGLTDVGQIREHNEDNFIIGDLDVDTRWDGSSGEATSMPIGVRGLLFAVCDGMGGAAAGEVASQMAADIVYTRMRSASSLLAKNQRDELKVDASGDGGDAESYRDRDALALDIVTALERSGAEILQEATANRARRGMGTTATVAALVDDHLLLGQVGDSRAYILREGQLVQVTRDQSLVNQLIEAGQLTEEEAETFEHSNIILQALGTAEVVQVDLTYARLRRGDVLMMCSDGLSGMLRKAELQETLSQVTDPAEACRVLIREANSAGGHDNITVICARFNGADLEPVDEASVASLAYTKYELPRFLGVSGVAAGGAEGNDGDGPIIELIGDPILVELGPGWADDLLLGRNLPRREKSSESLFYTVILLLLGMLAYWVWQRFNG